MSVFGILIFVGINLYTGKWSPLPGIRGTLKTIGKSAALMSGVRISVYWLTDTYPVWCDGHIIPRAGVLEIVAILIIMLVVLPWILKIRKSMIT